ncbi:hypothetical protein StoSoilA2_39240 [Arthrobacter sp. StoSoilA2]|uniref:hypothetical protein n=1 Tax=Arthrobacter sp. StoSoilA2 TaxID=2830990 RepID=UPI001CC81194|nr:hypothetical protein [Arthrobacter sp. StoSoilA2]BCW37868.1 hypothetical protein StoSoilA2_39240 [Arthrobacter sp. StoSoilA2]
MTVIEVPHAGAEAMGTIAFVIWAVFAGVGVAGLVAVFLQQTMLRAERSTNPWKFYPNLRRRWVARLEPFLPKMPRDRREMILDLKQNTSTAFVICTFGFGTATAFYLLLSALWQFERLQNWNGFQIASTLGVTLGALAALLVFALQLFISRRRRLLGTALTLVLLANKYGPSSTAADKRTLVAAGGSFLAAARRLGFSAENKRISRIANSLSDEGRKDPGNVNSEMIKQVSRLVREVYKGNHSMRIKSRYGGILSGNLRQWITVISSSTVVVAIVDAARDFLAPPN